MWTADFSQDRALFECRKQLERRGFSFRINEHSVVVTHPGLVTPWIIHSKEELIRLGELYGGANGESLSEGTVWDTFDDRDWSLSGKMAGPRRGRDGQRGQTSPRDRLAELEAENQRLRERGALAVKQRDEWERRALSAEARIAPPASSRADKRFEALKRLLARELHPDQVQGDGLEKILRAEMFKRLWPKVEAIERTEGGG